MSVPFGCCGFQDGLEQLLAEFLTLVLAFLRQLAPEIAAYEGQWTLLGEPWGRVVHRYLLYLQIHDCW
jgi:hypothetical protein